MILSANVGPASYERGGRIWHFQPRGELLVCMGDGRRIGTAERRANPIDKIEGGGLAGRIFVGLSVGQTPKYTLEQVVEATVAIRKKQGALPDATFLAQRGVYTGGEGKLVHEDSVQIVIIDMEGQTEKKFTAAMQDLAEQLRARFEQESVILEIQRRGLVRAIYSVRV